MVEGTIRRFESGATRDRDDDKLDYDGFFSGPAMETFAEYMHRHRIQSDGSLRDSDNWQKGIPVVQYRKSMWRHFVDMWKISRGYTVRDRRDGHLITLEEALCGIWFNVQGMLDTLARERMSRDVREITPGITFVP